MRLLALLLKTVMSITSRVGRIKTYCKEQGLDAPIAYTSAVDGITTPYAISVHLSSTDRLFEYDGNIIFVLKDSAPNELLSILDGISEPTLLTARMTESHHLQIGEGGYDTTSRYISFLIYLISCKFLAYLKIFFRTL